MDPDYVEALRQLGDARDSARFGGFSDAELSELVIALDHRVAEGHAGNEYVWLTEAENLYYEAEAEENARRHA